jgi:DNA modification methylase
MSQQKPHDQPQVRTVATSELKDNPEDPRNSRDQEQVNKLTKSIEKEGLLNPIPLKKDLTIVDGHARRDALLQLGINRLTVFQIQEESLYAVPTQGAEHDLDISSMAANVLRQDATTAEQARFIVRMIEERVLNQLENHEIQKLSDNDNDARECVNILNHLENVERPDRAQGWNYSTGQESLDRILTAADLKSRTARAYAENYLKAKENAPAVFNAWEDGSIESKNAVEALRLIEDDSIRTTLLERMKNQQYTVTELQDLSRVIRKNIPSVTAAIEDGVLSADVATIIAEIVEEHDLDESVIQDGIAEITEELSDNELSQKQSIKNIFDPAQTESPPTESETPPTESPEGEVDNPEEDDVTDEPEDTEEGEEEKISLTEKQKSKIQEITQNLEIEPSSYIREFLTDTDDIDSVLSKHKEQIQQKNTQQDQQLEPFRSREEREDEREKSLEEFDFAEESRFATGDADHLASPVETENLGVFFHDCLQMDDEIGDDPVQLVFTSPPYFTQRGKIVEKWWPEDQTWNEENADIAYENYLDEMMKIFQKCASHLDEGGHLMLNLSDYQVENLKLYDIPSDISYRIRHDLEVDLNYVSTITWDKGDGETSKRLANFRTSNDIADFKPAWQTERILVFRKGLKREDQDYKINREKMKNTYDFNPFADLWKAEPTTTNYAEHESGFPRRLPYLAVKLFTYPGDTIIDPFGGYCTTLRAIKELNEERDDAPPRKGFAWENFASETSEQPDYRKQIKMKLGTDPLSDYINTQA